MDIKRCVNGHWFDGDNYQTCPHCGGAIVGADNRPNIIKDPAPGSASGNELKSSDKPKKKKGGLLGGFWNKPPKHEKTERDLHKEVNDEILEVQDKNDSLGTGDEKTVDIYKHENDETVPYSEYTGDDSYKNDRPVFLFDDDKTESYFQKVDEEDDGWNEFQKNRSAGEVTEQDIRSESLSKAVERVSANEEGKTLSYFQSVSARFAQEAETPAEPVVGWLTCIEGPHKGQSFQLYSGNNSIGRENSNRIVLNKDNSVSREKHALLVYEPKKRDFYLKPGDESGLTYLNDEFMMDKQKLTSYDVITLGNAKLVFIPLCGDKFSWEDYM